MYALENSVIAGSPHEVTRRACSVLQLTLYGSSGHCWAGQRTSAMISYCGCVSQDQSECSRVLGCLKTGKWDGAHARKRCSQGEM